MKRCAAIPVYRGLAVSCSALLVFAVAGCATVRPDDRLQTASAPAAMRKAEVRQLAKSSRSWDGAPLPAYPQGVPEITILRIVIPPGTALPMHEHPVINAGVLVKGALTVQTKEGNVLHLAAGDPIIEVAKTWHCGKNEGSEPAEIIVFYAGSEGTPITTYEPQHKP